MQKLPPLEHLEGPGTGAQQLGCLVAAEIAAYTAQLLLLCSSGVRAKMCQSDTNSLHPCSTAHARTAAVIEDCSVLGAWMAV